MPVERDELVPLGLRDNLPSRAVEAGSVREPAEPERPATPAPRRADLPVNPCWPAPRTAALSGAFRGGHGSA